MVNNLDISTILAYPTTRCRLSLLKISMSIACTLGFECEGIGTRCPKLHGLEHTDSGKTEDLSKNIFGSLLIFSTCSPLEMSTFCDISIVVGGSTTLPGVGLTEITSQTELVFANVVEDIVPSRWIPIRIERDLLLELV